MIKLTITTSLEKAYTSKLLVHQFLLTGVTTSSRAPIKMQNNKMLRISRNRKPVHINASSRELHEIFFLPFCFNFAFINNQTSHKSYCISSSTFLELVESQCIKVRTACKSFILSVLEPSGIPVIGTPSTPFISNFINCRWTLYFVLSNLPHLSGQELMLLNLCHGAMIPVTGIPDGSRTDFTAFTGLVKYL